jgi:Ni/Fe-hydrogenase subunit HybB-like protein
MMRSAALALAIVAAAVLLGGIHVGVHAQKATPDLGRILQEGAEPPPEAPSGPAPGAQKWVLTIGLLPVVALIVIVLLMRWFGLREQEALMREGGAPDADRDSLG